MKKDKCTIGREVVLLGFNGLPSYHKGLVISSEMVVRGRVTFVEVKDAMGVITEVPISRLEEKSKYESLSKHVDVG